MESSNKKTSSQLEDKSVPQGSPCTQDCISMKLKCTNTVPCTEPKLHIPCLTASNQDPSQHCASVYSQPTQAYMGIQPNQQAIMVRGPGNDCMLAEPITPACCITNDSGLDNLFNNRALKQASTKCSDFSEHNSYRFSKPRIFCPNNYVSKEQNTADILADIATNVGP